MDEAAISALGNVQGMRLSWGATEEPEYFDVSEYKNSAIAAKYAYNNTSATDKDTRYLKSEDDIVQINWPAGWNIPTARDFELLIANTKITSETIEGHIWFRLTSKINNNSILIPATSYIDNNKDIEKIEVWGLSAYLQSSTIGLQSDKPTLYALLLSSSGGSLANKAGRPTGLMVRPVRYVRVY